MENHKFNDLSKDELLQLTFTDLIKIYRKNKGWSQEKLAREINAISKHCSTSYIVKLEQGKRTPNVEIILDISKALDIDLDLISIIVDKDTLRTLAKKQAELALKISKSEIEFTRKNIADLNISTEK